MTGQSKIDEIRERHASHRQVDGSLFGRKAIDELRRDMDTLLAALDAANQRAADAERRLSSAATKIQEAIEIEEPDAGVFLLSQESTFHSEVHNGQEVSVYDNEYFTPLGDKLMEIYAITRGEHRETSSGSKNG